MFKEPEMLRLNGSLKAVCGNNDDNGDDDDGDDGDKEEEEE